MFLTPYTFLKSGDRYFSSGVLYPESKDPYDTGVNNPRPPNLRKLRKISFS